MNDWILVRGAGDIATGVIVRLVRCGYRVAALETAHPTAIRRSVALSEAVYDGSASVEGISARLVSYLPERPDFVPLLIDPDGDLLQKTRPAALVDAILAKRNTGTRRDMAPFTVALGPGFTAGVDTDAVVETMRGHTLGRVIYEGSAIPNTGIPGTVGGESVKRVVHAPCTGTLRVLRDIGSVVTEGDLLAELDGTPILSPLTGLVRGMLRDGFAVPQGMKMADVDPRPDADWHHCSDKALAVAGGVLEALLHAGIRPSL